MFISSLWLMSCLKVSGCGVLQCFMKLPNFSADSHQNRWPASQLSAALFVAKVLRGKLLFQAVEEKNGLGLEDANKLCLLSAMSLTAKQEPIKVMQGQDYQNINSNGIKMFLYVTFIFLR